MVAESFYLIKAKLMSLVSFLYIRIFYFPFISIFTTFGFLDLAQKEKKTDREKKNR